MTLKLAATSSGQIEKLGANGSAGPPIMKIRFYDILPQKIY